MGCRNEHTPVLRMMPFVLYTDDQGGFVGSVAEVLWCADCGAWLSLGKATDDERTAVELAASARAAEWRDENYRPGYDRFEYCPATQSDDLCGQCEALYLAHFIVEPDTTPSGESGEKE